MRSYLAAWLMAGALCLTASCTDEWFPPGSEDLPFNFHVLDEGRAYRSAQPTGDALQAVIENFGIRTVINLRGYNPDKLWYQAEAGVCEAMGIELVNHSMSANSLPSAELLGAIVETLLTAEYPILIHCQMGADRTGLVSVIYRMLILGHDKLDALAELSPVYLHLRQFKPCMDTLAELYEPGDDWLSEYAATIDQIACMP